MHVWHASSCMLNPVQRTPVGHVSAGLLHGAHACRHTCMHAQRHGGPLSWFQQAPESRRPDASRVVRRGCPYADEPRACGTTRAGMLCCDVCCAVQVTCCAQRAGASSAGRGACERTSRSSMGARTAPRSRSCSPRSSSSSCRSDRRVCLSAPGRTMPRPVRPPPRPRGLQYRMPGSQVLFTAALAAPPHLPASTCSARRCALAAVGSGQRERWDSCKRTAQLESV